MFYCECCNYKTKNRSKIQSHHIIPVELNGSNSKSNRVYLCPTCHSKVYIKEARSGQHSIKGLEYLVIDGWKLSTLGKVLIYFKNEIEIIQKSKNEF